MIICIEEKEMFALISNDWSHPAFSDIYWWSLSCSQPHLVRTSLLEEIFFVLK